MDGSSKPRTVNSYDCVTNGWFEQTKNSDTTGGLSGSKDQEIVGNGCAKLPTKVGVVND